MIVDPRNRTNLYYVIGEDGPGKGPPPNRQARASCSVGFRSRSSPTALVVYFFAGGAHLLGGSRPRKGKPVARRGRKAQGPLQEVAGLPKGAPDGNS
jgi:hypothetical protein